jgi:hypothetical protein
MSWRESKDAAAEAYRAGRITDALVQYSSALDQLSSLSSTEEDVQRGDEGGRRGGGGRVGSDRQILLSNVVACRLKIGGTDMVEKAVEEAKEVRSSVRYAFVDTTPRIVPMVEHRSHIGGSRRRRGMISIHSLVRVHDPPPARAWR